MPKRDCNVTGRRSILPRLSATPGLFSICWVCCRRAIVTLVWYHKNSRLLVLQILRLSPSGGGVLGRQHVEDAGKHAFTRTWCSQTVVMRSTGTISACALAVIRVQREGTYQWARAYYQHLLPPLLLLLAVVGARSNAASCLETTTPGGLSNAAIPR